MCVLNITIESKYSIGDIVKVKGKNIGVIDCIEIRHHLTGSTIQYTVAVLSAGSSREAWCTSKDLTPHKIDKNVIIKDT